MILESGESIEGVVCTKDSHNSEREATDNTHSTMHQRRHLFQILDETRKFDCTRLTIGGAQNR